MQNSTNTNAPSIIGPRGLPIMALLLSVSLVSPSLGLAQSTSLFHGDDVNGSSQGSGGQVVGPHGSDTPVISAPYGQTPPPHPGLAAVSWTYTPPLPRRVFQIHDIVTIRVDEIARVLAEGSAESRKITQYSAVLSDWIRLTQGRLQPDEQPNGDPSVAGNTNNQYRAESDVDTSEALTFNIAARIVDIRPNGNLVLEARKKFRVNDNLWETALSGICRAQDVGPDNVVLSRDLIDLEIDKQDQGQLRDGYKRGWFTRWFDRLQPF
ncbi:Flagellar L-ring protein precursor [Crateriforma conspicua]|uniref:Flagellar L-ring protein n=2 Tax=Crateriforma conspicua TaxID=2527996 RepID=A0A5C5Y3T0_9PLAN|nr:Flagellar L-ring protein precursor [Crateriforma conspicua]TWT69900.1 Flagellar L-ring protein precursor [Crateriforma conspicua]